MTLQEFLQEIRYWGFHIGDGVGDNCSGTDEKAEEEAAADLFNRMVPSWISVKEKLPHLLKGISDPVLVCPHKGDISAARYTRAYGWVSSPGAYAMRPTHWMPLPDPPKEEK